VNVTLTPISPTIRVLSAIACFRQLSLCRLGGPREHGVVPKRLIRRVINALAGIAVVVFILARMTTNTGLLPFVGVNRRATRLLRSVEALGG
jgi:hypothetical protein